MSSVLSEMGSKVAVRIEEQVVGQVLKTFGRTRGEADGVGTVGESGRTCSQSVVPGPTASVSPESLLDANSQAPL